MPKQNKTKAVKSEKKNIPTYIQMFSCWGKRGEDGSTQYRYSQEELFYLTQGL